MEGADAVDIGFTVNDVAINGHVDAFIGQRRSQVECRVWGGTEHFELDEIVPEIRDVLPFNCNPDLKLILTRKGPVLAEGRGLAPLGHIGRPVLKLRRSHSGLN